MYTSFANPLQVAVAGVENFSLDAADGDQVYTTTITNDGIIMGILAFVNFRNLSGGTAGTRGTLTFQLRRNNVILASSTLPIDTWYTDTGGAGLVWVETLNVLAGAEVKAGETFTLYIVNTIGDSTTLPTDAKVSIVVRPQFKEYSV